MDRDGQSTQRSRRWLAAALLLTAGMAAGFVIASDLGLLRMGYAVPDAPAVAPPPPVARPVATAPQPTLAEDNQTFVQIAKAVKPAVVNINSTKSGRSGGSGTMPFEDPLFRRLFSLPA